MKTINTKNMKLKLASAIAVVMAAPSAFAQGTDALGVTGPLKVLTDALSGPIAGGVLTLGIAAVGFSFVSSEQGQPMKTGLRIVGAGAIIVGAAGAMRVLFSGAFLL